jgi:transmembrane sensor
MNLATTDGMIATVAGESQTTTFDDGGVVSVKPNSRVLLDAYESERRLDLLKGEAVFTATPVPNRPPLVVSTYIARASAVDATFKVALDGGMVVEVYEGQVDVAVPGRSAITLKKGNRYRVIEELSDSVVAQERGQEVPHEWTARES